MLSLIYAVIGCQCRKDNDDDDDDSTSSTVPITSTGYLGASQQHVRLIPEQISKKLSTQLGLRWGFTDNNGIFHDRVIEDYGVALGGVDFNITQERDSETFVQTALVIRGLSWEIANLLVSRDQDGPSDSVEIADVFTIADIKTDLPAAAGGTSEQDSRFKQQIDALYWRIFLRPPTQEEIQVLTEGFTTVLRAESEFPPAAWVATLYMMISTMEFWTI